MIDHTLISPEKVEKSIIVCQRKRRYPDEISARVFAMNSIQQTDETLSLYVYRCNVCAGWHLTRFHVGVPVTANDPFYVKPAEQLQVAKAETVEIPKSKPQRSYGFLRRRKAYQVTA